MLDDFWPLAKVCNPLTCIFPKAAAYILCFTFVRHSTALYSLVHVLTPS